MTEQLERFITLLKGIFELDKSDLDFGIYRIMNIRKKEIEKFLTEGLPQKVQEALKPFAANTGDIEKRIAEIEKQCESVGVPVANSKMAAEYTELKATLAKGMDLSGLEADVYSHLYSFFNRYYEEGDFISKRRYKEGVYAIPYEGEEVKLYWANQDQYYIKTSENFKDYTFVAEGYTIHFKLVDATTEQNNNKESADNKRVFMLYTENPEQPELKTFEFDAEKKEFIIRFIFDVPPEKKFDYATDNAKKIVQWIATNCSPLVTVLLPNVSNDPKKPLTLIEKHLKAYVAKNTFDYFIHKDLHKFLSRELDFYIKNEVMHLDDVDTPDEKQVSTYLAKVRAIKRVGNILIEFLASIEDFQKKLWLKKKFVVQCDYCITLDRIPEELYPEIAANDEQREEWVKLCAIDRIVAQKGGFEQGIWYKDVKGKANLEKRKIEGRKFGYSIPLDIGFLKENRFLMVDTKFFSDDFKSRLLASIDDFDKQCDGLLIHSENFQALKLIQQRYREKCKNIYIDPPYNTGGGDFLFKDSFYHGSWASMFFDRLKLATTLLNEQGLFACHMDEHEQWALENIVQSVFGISRDLGKLVWDKRNPKGEVAGLASQHEYVHFATASLDFLGMDDAFVRDKPNAPAILAKAAKMVKQAKGVTEKVRLEFAEWVKDKSNNFSNGEKAYCFLDDKGEVFQTVSMAAPDKPETRSHRPLIHPVTKKPCPVPAKGWRFPDNTMDNLLSKNEVVFGPDETTQPRRKYLLRENMTENVPSVYYMGGSDDKLFKNMNLHFENPKPVEVGCYFLKAMMRKSDTPIVLDFFAGSGTAAHSVIALNRNDGSHRKYILVDMGEHFNTVIMPRIKKIVYASDWQDALPKEIFCFRGKDIIEETKKILKHDDGTEELIGISTSCKGTEVEETPDWKEDNPFNGISHCFKYLTLESYEDALNNVTLPDDKTTEQWIARFGEEYLVKYMLDLNAAGSVLNLDKFKEPFSYKLKVTEKNETKEVNVDLMETFNYLIGLTVEKLYARNTFTAVADSQGEYEGAVKLTPDKNGNYTFRQIEGKLPDGRRCLILWRNVTENLAESNAALDAYFQRYRINPADREYDLIYVNGDNNLENLKAEDETWKVRMIEPEFKKLMFEEN